jgi:DnaJ-class molecular chaperone
MFLEVKKFVFYNHRAYEILSDEDKRRQHDN